LLISAIKKNPGLKFWLRRGCMVTLNVCKSFYLIFQFVSVISILSIIKISCMLMFIATEYGIT
jgi:hypothetical protein